MDRTYDKKNGDFDVVRDPVSFHSQDEAAKRGSCFARLEPAEPSRKRHVPVVNLLDVHFYAAGVRISEYGREYVFNRVSSGVPNRNARNMERERERVQRAGCLCTDHLERRP